MAQEHTVKAFDEDITRLRGLIAEMGGLAEVSLAEAMEALVKGNSELAKGVIARDKRIDALEAEVDKLEKLLAHEGGDTLAHATYMCNKVLPVLACESGLAPSCMSRFAFSEKEDSTARCKGV